MLKRRAAAAADHVDAEFLDEMRQPLGEFARREWEDRFVVDRLRQAGVGQATDLPRALLAQLLHVADHLLRPERAVHADDRHFAISFPCRYRPLPLSPA